MICSLRFFEITRSRNLECYVFQTFQNLIQFSLSMVEVNKKSKYLRANKIPFIFFTKVLFIKLSLCSDIHIPKFLDVIPIQNLLQSNECWLISDLLLNSKLFLFLDVSLKFSYTANFFEVFSRVTNGSLFIKVNVSLW